MRGVVATKRERGRSVEEAVSFAIAHRIRIEILGLLNEGAKSPDELAKLIGQSLNKVSHHVKELLEAGSIEVARTEKVRNATRHIYRSIKLAYNSDEEWDALSPEEKQETCGVILQAIMAESLSSFWAEKMIDDPRLWLTWRWFNVDGRGRDEIADEQARSWARIQEIEAEASARRTESGEDAGSVIVASMGFVRTRDADPLPPSTNC